MSDDSACPDQPSTLTPKATAVAVRRALRAAFAGVTFSVRAQRGSSYGWLHVTWTDGPSEAQVVALTHPFLATHPDCGRAGESRVDDGRPRSSAYALRGISTHRFYTDAVLLWMGGYVDADPQRFQTALIRGDREESVRNGLRQLDLTKGRDIFDRPCEECLAEAGEPCRWGCTPCAGYDDAVAAESERDRS